MSGLALCAESLISKEILNWASAGHVRNLTVAVLQAMEPAQAAVLASTTIKVIVGPIL